MDLKRIVDQLLIAYKKTSDKKVKLRLSSALDQLIKANIRVNQRK